MTAAERAAWAAAGVAATVVSLAALAVHWGRAVERNEAYGTWQEQPDRYAGMASVERETAKLDRDEARMDAELVEQEHRLNHRRSVLAAQEARQNGCRLCGLLVPCSFHTPDELREAARVSWHRETRHVGPPLRVEPYRPEGET